MRALSKLILILSAILTSGALLAQGNDNDWIKYNQKYFSIPISSSGVYRVPGSVLQSLPVPGLTTNQVKVFARGSEQFTYVYDANGNGVFETNDFLEFYAKANDGWLDTAVYDNPASTGNRRYSLFNDTINYFLTFSTSGSPLRYIVDASTNYSSYSQVPFIYKEEVQVYSNEYQSSANDPEYTQGEGWSDYAFGITNSSVFQSNYIVKTVNTPNAYTAAGNAEFKTCVLSGSNNNHELVMQASDNGSSWFLILDSSFYSYKTIELSGQLPVSTGTTTSVKYQTQGIYTSGRMSVSYLSLNYPHTLDLENKNYFPFTVDNGTGAKNTLTFTNFNGSTPVVLYDLSNNMRMPVTSSGSSFQSLLSNLSSSGRKECLLFAENSVKVVTALNPVNANGFFTDYHSAEADYLIVTNSTLLNEAQQYATYRASVTGGMHNVKIVNVDYLYDQFGYGIEKHPLSIKNYLKYINTNWATQPDNLFLIGKSIHSNLSRKATGNYMNNLVPSFGTPASDILLSAGFDTAYVPSIPVGRLAVNNGIQITDYLHKVQEYDTTSAAEWRKNILHFAGGTSAGEQQLFENYLGVYEDILEDTSFGGNVYLFKKTSSAPIQITVSDSVKRLIDGGVSFMTFFGHAAGSGFDQSIDDPSAYSNHGKYPVIMANSCYVGDVHQPISGALGTSESFVLAKERGAIAFIAEVFEGYPGPLFDYTGTFFRKFSGAYYGESIGKIMQQTIKSVVPLGNHKSVCLEMLLHGDPALVINSAPKPDLKINQSSVFTSPAVVSTIVDSFDVHVAIANIGKATNTSFSVELKRIYPGQDDTVYVKTVNGLHYKDTITFRLPVAGMRGTGLNSLTVTVDPLNINLVDELQDVMNNIVSTALIIKSGEITPVYPYNFSIVGKDTVTLKASTGDLFAPVTRYRFEVDTTDLFNSPFLKHQVIEQSGGVVKAYSSKWKNNVGLQQQFNLSDSVVYFWRVSPDSTSGASAKHIWRESSFQHINNKRGWEQDHFFQFKSDNFKFVGYDRTSRTFTFEPNSKKLHVQTYGTPQNINELYSSQYKLDSDLGYYSACFNVPQIIVAVIDPVTLEPWQTRFIDNGDTLNPNNNFGNVNDNGGCLPRVDKAFIYYMHNAQQMAGLKDLLQNKVPNGYHVMAYTSATSVNDPDPLWADTSAYQGFDAIGPHGLRGVSSTRPFIFYGIKGTPSSTETTVGSTGTSFIQDDHILSNNWTYGEITSSLIGPASQWDSLYWNYKTFEGAASPDSIAVSLIGVKSNGTEQLIRNYTSAQLNNRIDSVDANIFPYIKLKAFLKDDVNHTAPQLDRWHVIFEGVPEAALNPAVHYTANDTIGEGSQIEVSIAVENISDYPMDSLLVLYRFSDNNNSVRKTTFQRIAPLPAGQSLNASHSFSSLGYTGKNSLWVEVNPVPPGGSGFDQLEQYHFNNIADINYLVNSDKTNPLLDVTFDGQHIMNGDIVSAKPQIVIQLKDENKYLALDTSALLKVFIKQPDATEDKLIPFDESSLIFTPASLPDNKCKIEYNPVFDKDGIYELSVQATDASNNRSGNIDYRISFEVINKSTITQVVNYPNPFSRSTRFVFTLTGSVVPDFFKIQIMTVTGKIVREVYSEELGEIHIGKNITDFVWDGTDQYGDPLANGLYLYRVVTKIQDTDIERRNSGADQYFKHGWGKMYLMR